MKKRASRQETLLEAAFHELALEETRQLKDQMMFDPSLSAQAEQLHRQNSRRISALIGKRLGKKRHQGWIALSAAACLALALLGALRLTKAPEDHAIRPGPSVISLTAQPGGTTASTNTPLPTASPAATPVPTATPSPTPAPTATPSPAPTSLMDSWRGSFFPVRLPEGYTLVGVLKGEEAGAAHQARFRNAQAAELMLSEYETARVMQPGPGESGFRYVKLPSGFTALVTEDGSGGARVVWDQEGRTLMAYATTGSAEAMAFAASIQKLK